MPFMPTKLLLFLGISCVIALALRAATLSVATPPPLLLHEACQARSIDQLNATIKTLTDNGTIAAEINRKDNNENTALHLAAKEDNNDARLAMVKALLAAGASIKILNETDSLPMDFLTATNGQEDLCFDLLYVSPEEKQQLVLEDRNQENIDADKAEGIQPLPIPDENDEQPDAISEEQSTLVID
ncbi:ankyrin repeat domain-containing protein [Candidatus Dependentiae bacterium]|nr:ankyrin repeat domain-containing protein [Candidatus Dependentiae bacterium]